MKKYFMQGTADEVKFGDMINLDLTKELPNGNVQHHHLECKFIPELIPMLIENSIIEEKSFKEKENPKSSAIEEDNFQKLFGLYDLLTQRIQELENTVKHLYDEVYPSKPQPHKPNKNARKATRK